MSEDYYINRAKTYLKRLCIDITERYVGCDGNREATEFFSRVLQSFGYHIERQPFQCIDWYSDPTILYSEEKMFQCFPSPYSIGCDLNSEICVISTIKELENTDTENKIVLLKGEIAKEQLMPKNFPFYNHREHKYIIQLLENKKINAIITASPPNNNFEDNIVPLSGGMYPFPMFDDGDFDIPSVYMSVSEAERLAQYNGKKVSLNIKSLRIPEVGYNIIGRRNTYFTKKIVFTAHIDSKEGSPGALDNASGITVLLLLVEMMLNNSSHYQFEFVALNGEDYYSNPGEVLYRDSNIHLFSNIELNVNIDGVALKDSNIAVSEYNCPSFILNKISNSLKNEKEIIFGNQWYQGDHSLFAQNNVPAIAFTSENVYDAFKIIHTPNDTINMLDYSKLFATANYIYWLINEM